MALSLVLGPRPAAAEALTLETLMQALAAVPERRATFRETRRFAALEGALESTGHLAYGPGRLEKVTDWPQAERLVVTGDRVVLTAGNEPPRVIDLGMVPDLRVLIDAIRGPLTGDAAALRRAFTPLVSGGMDGWTLDLTPLPSGKPGLLRSVQMEGRGDAVGRITLTQTNGDTQVMAITPG